MSRKPASKKGKGTGMNTTKDPTKSKVFVQSHVSAHSELVWLLNYVTPMSWLTRMIQFKDKAKKLELNLLVLVSSPTMGFHPEWTVLLRRRLKMSVHHSRYRNLRSK